MVLAKKILFNWYVTENILNLELSFFSLFSSLNKVMIKNLF